MERDRPGTEAGHNAKITSLILLEYLGTRRDSVTGTINLDIAQSLKAGGT